MKVNKLNESLDTKNIKLTENVDDEFFEIQDVIGTALNSIGGDMDDITGGITSSYDEDRLIISLYSTVERKNARSFKKKFFETIENALLQTRFKEVSADEDHTFAYQLSRLDLHNHMGSDRGDEFASKFAMFEILITAYAEKLEESVRGKNLTEWNEFSDDDFDDDQMHAAVYGGDSKYCKDCGTVKVYDEDGFSYCPKCNESLNEARNNSWQPPENWISHKGAWIYPAGDGYEANFMGQHFEAPTLDELKVKLRDAREHRTHFVGSEKDKQFADNIKKYGRELQEVKVFGAKGKKKLDEGTGADTAHAISSVLSNISKDDNKQWVNTVTQIIDIVPDEYIDDLYDIAKTKLDNVTVDDKSKEKIISASGQRIENAQEADTVGKLLSLIDVTDWDAGTLKRYTLVVLGIIAVIEPGPIVDVITGIVALLPPNLIKGILSITNAIGNPIGLVGTIANKGYKAIKNRKSESLIEANQLLPIEVLNPDGTPKQYDVKFMELEKVPGLLNWDVADQLEQHFRNNRLWVDELHYNEVKDCIEYDINWGDWKHEHLRSKWLLEELFKELGIVAHINSHTTEEDGSDTYSAHYIVRAMGKMNEAIEPPTGDDPDLSAIPQIGQEVMYRGKRTTIIDYEQDPEYGYDFLIKNPFWNGEDERFENIWVGDEIDFIDWGPDDIGLQPPG